MTPEEIKRKAPSWAGAYFHVSASKVEYLKHKDGDYYFFNDPINNFTILPKRFHKEIKPL